MTLYSYVVRWDHGFAPNPFHGICTLATCKPDIRKKAKLGDWVLGTGSAERQLAGHAIFLMQVRRVLTFDEYWSEGEFQCKQPVMNGSLKQRFGDNIYSHNEQGAWTQADSRHSLDDGTNSENLKGDTRVDRVLVAGEFRYWGESAPKIPDQFASFVISRPGWKEDFSQEETDDFLAWARKQGDEGQTGLPVEWRDQARWDRIKGSRT